jgi:hypothetical protein
MKKKVKKPKFIEIRNKVSFGIEQQKFGGQVYIIRPTFGAEDVNSQECRKLAAWLIKAADYLEAKDKTK